MAGHNPPDMSVLAKARKGGASYIYSILLGYDDPPPDVSLEDGVLLQHLYERK